MTEDLLVIVDAKLEAWIEKIEDDLAIAAGHVHLSDTCKVVDEMEELRVKIKERLEQTK